MRTSTNPIKIITIVLFALLALCGIVWLIVWLVTPTPDNLTIQGFYWEREIVLEELVIYEGEGWDLPFGARVDYTSEEVYEYDEDGDPVYRTYYYYYEEEWERTRSIVTSGTDKNPFWDNDFILRYGEREGRRYETYSVLARNSNGEEKYYHFSLMEWNLLEIGETYRVNTYVGGNAEMLR